MYGTKAIQLTNRAFHRCKLLFALEPKYKIFYRACSIQFVSSSVRLNLIILVDDGQNILVSNNIVIPLPRWMFELGRNTKNYELETIR